MSQPIIPLKAVAQPTGKFTEYGASKGQVLFPMDCSLNHPLFFASKGGEADRKGRQGGGGRAIGIGSWSLKRFWILRHFV